MFTKIFIANRGEIACRAIKTARNMDIATVAGYSETNKNTRHVALADVAVCIAPAASRLSYLVQDNIACACRQAACASGARGLWGVKRKRIAHRWVVLREKSLKTLGASMAMLPYKPHSI